MKPLGLNLKGAKKVSADEHSSTFQLGSGHKIQILHAPLSAIHRKQIEALPLQKMADGGDVQPTQKEIDQSKQSYSSPDVDPSTVETGDGGYRVNPQALDQEVASRAPSSIAGDVGNYLGSAVRQSVGDATTAFKSLFTPVGDAASGLVHGILGKKEGAVEEKTSTPAPQSDLPGMGEPVVGASGPAPASNGSLPAARGQIPDVSVGGIYSTGLQGIQAQQEAESGAGAARLQADKMYAAHQVAEEANWETERQSKMQEVNAAIEDAKNGHINPNHYLENQSTGGKIATAIGLILGGAGAHSTGGQNLALNFMNDQINRDINAQKADQETKMNLIGAYQAKYHDAVSAENMARATLYGIYASRLQQGADQSADPLAKARALQAKSALQSQILPLVNQANAIHMLNARSQQKSANPGAFSQTAVDYPAFNTLQKTGIMPQPDVEAATKEANQAEDVKSIRDFYNRSFGELNSKFLAGSLTPADRASFVNTLTGKIQKTSEGRYNGDAAAKIAEGMFPSGGDLDKTRGDKLKNGNEFLSTLQAGTSTLDRYGLKNPSAPAPTHQQKIGDIVRVNGKKAQIIDKHGNYKFVQ